MGLWLGLTTIDTPRLATTDENGPAILATPMLSENCGSVHNSVASEELALSITSWLVGQFSMSGGVESTRNVNGDWPEDAAARV